MDLVAVIPHVSGALNTLVALLLFAGWRAIRRGDRVAHPRWMRAALATGALFIAVYGLQTVVQGHHRFPGDDWLRGAFVLLLGTHTALAVAVVPMLLRTYYLASRDRLESHRRWARVTFPVWAYVAVTGVIIYLMNNWVRPH